MRLHQSLSIESLLSPFQGSRSVVAATGGSAAARLAPGYFLGVPPGRPGLRRAYVFAALPGRPNVRQTYFSVFFRGARI